jgi:hypothetical protein
LSDFLRGEIRQNNLPLRGNCEMSDLPDNYEAKQFKHGAIEKPDNNARRACCFSLSGVSAEREKKRITLRPLRL